MHMHFVSHAVSTINPSPTVTHTPVKEGPRGVNVAAAVATPIIILLIILVIGITVTVMVLVARHIQKRRYNIHTDLELSEYHENNTTGIMKPLVLIYILGYPFL